MHKVSLSKTPNLTPRDRANKDFEHYFKKELKEGGFIPARLAGGYLGRRIRYWEKKLKVVK